MNFEDFVKNGCHKLITLMKNLDHFNVPLIKANKVRFDFKVYQSPTKPIVKLAAVKYVFIWETFRFKSPT